MNPTFTPKISLEKPPNWNSLEQKFGVKWENTAVAYGDTIHTLNQPSEDLLAHELVHLSRQGGSISGAIEWWNKYMTSPSFRLEEEALAYAEQFRVYKTFVKDRNKRYRFLSRLAKDLCGTMYGSICSHGEALSLIENN